MRESKIQIWNTILRKMKSILKPYFLLCIKTVLSSIKQQRDRNLHVCTHVLCTYVCKIVSAWLQNGNLEKSSTEILWKTKNVPGKLNTFRAEKHFKTLNSKIWYQLEPEYLWQKSLLCYWLPGYKYLSPKVGRVIETWR